MRSMKSKPLIWGISVLFSLSHPVENQPPHTPHCPDWLSTARVLWLCNFAAPSQGSEDKQPHDAEKTTSLNHSVQGDHFRGQMVSLIHDMYKMSRVQLHKAWQNVKTEEGQLTRLLETYSPGAENVFPVLIQRQNGSGTGKWKVKLTGR